MPPQGSFSELLPGAILVVALVAIAAIWKAVMPQKPPGKT